MAIHQNHDYGYHPQGKYGVWNDEHAARNYQLAVGPPCMRTIDDASELLEDGALRRNPRHYLRNAVRPIHLGLRALRYNVWNPLWFAALGATRPLRTTLGLRSRAVRLTYAKNGSA